MGACVSSVLLCARASRDIGHLQHDIIVCFCNLGTSSRGDFVTHKNTPVAVTFAKSLSRYSDVPFHLILLRSLPIEKTSCFMIDLTKRISDDFTLRFGNFDPVDRTQKLPKMPFDSTVKLPTDEELTVEEIPVTFNYLLASAMWMGKHCDTQQKEYMLCRSEERDPRRCLEYGKDLTACGMDFLRKVKENCREELEWYTKCLDFTGRDPCPRYCRKPQAIFDGCMYDSGFDRAKFGHFQLLRVHDSERPKPKPTVPIFEDAVEPYNPYDEDKRQKNTINGKWFTRYY